MRGLGIRETVIFSRMIGAALLVCGFILMGLYIGRELVSRGYPSWTAPLCIVLGTLWALLAGWHEIRSITALIHKK